MITVLTGDNSYLIAQEVKRLEAGFDGSVERLEGDDVTREQLPDLMLGATLFASQRLIIIRQLSANKSVFSEVENYLENLPEDTHLVLVEQQLDKRTRVYKWLQKNAKIKNFVQKDLSDRELLSWLDTYAKEQGVDLGLDIKKLLIARLGTNQWDLSQAVQKLALWTKPITAEVVKDLIESLPQASVFELLNAIISKRRDRVGKLLADVELTDDAHLFLGVFGSQLFTLAAVKAADDLSDGQIASGIGAHPYTIKNLRPVARQISNTELTQMIEIMRQADLKMKSTGAKPWLVIEVAIGRMMAA